MKYKKSSRQKNHHVCWTCRLSFKGSYKCPECSSQLTEVGSAFRAPKRHKIDQWNKVKYLYDNGIRFAKDRNTQLGPMHTSWQAKEAIKLRHKLYVCNPYYKNDGEVLAEKWKK